MTIPLEKVSIYFLYASAFKLEKLLVSSQVYEKCLVEAESVIP